MRLGMERPRTGWCEARGASLRFAVQGDGPVVVLVHELGGALESWDAVAEHLADRYTVVRFDQRGAGRSEKPLAPFGVDELAGDLAAVLDALGIAGDVHLVGAAFGAAQLVAFARDRPERVRSLALLAPALTLTEEGRTVIASRAARAEEQGMRAVLDASLDRAWPPERRRDSPDFAAYRARYLAADPHSYALHNRALLETDLVAAAAALSSPALIVAGSRDAVRPAELVTAQTEGLAHAERVTVEAGHFMAVEQPDEVARVLLDFLDRQDPGSPRAPRAREQPIDALPPAARRAALEAASGARGRMPAPMRAWLASPEFAARAQALGEALRFRSSLPPRLSEFAILLMARRWRSDEEWRIHAPIARDAGLAAHTIEELRRGRTPAPQSADETAVLGVFLALEEDRRLGDELFARASRTLGEAGLAELLGLFGYYTLVSLTLNSYRIGAEAPSPFLTEEEDA